MLTTAPLQLLSVVLALTAVLATVSPLGTASVIFTLVPGCVGTAVLQPARACVLPATAVTGVLPIVKLYCAPCSAGLALHLQTFTVAAAGEFVIVIWVS